MRLLGAVELDPSHWQTKFLPENPRPFALAVADPREIRTSLLMGSTMPPLFLNIGQILSLLRFEQEGEGKDPIQWDLGIEGAAYFSLTAKGELFYLETGDGQFGVSVLYRPIASTVYSLQIIHLSAHLADGLTPTRTSFPYSREFLLGRVAHWLSNTFQVYGGGTVLLHSEPVLRPFIGQVGALWTLNYPNHVLGPYAAMDIQWKSYLSLNPSLSLQVGLSLGSNQARPYPGFHTVRIYGWYFSGADPRGQFYNSPFSGAGIGSDLPL